MMTSSGNGKIQLKLYKSFVYLVIFLLFDPVIPLIRNNVLEKETDKRIST